MAQKTKPQQPKNRQQTRFKRLQEISAKLLGQLELNPLLESLANGVVQFLDADSGGIYRYNTERGELDPTIHIRQPKEALYKVRPGEGMAGRVMQSGKSMKVDKYDEWAGRDPRQPRGSVGAVAQAPVKKRRQILGVLFAERAPGRPVFTNEDLADLELFASQAAIAISNAELYESARQSAEELASLYETSLEITRQLDVAKVLERIIQRASKLVNGKYGQFYQFDEERKLLVPAVPDFFPQSLRSVTMKPGEGLSGKVFLTRQPLIITDYDDWDGRAEGTPPGLFRRAIGIPVKHGEQILGVLSLARNANEPPFNQNDLRILSLFANQAAVALANAQQYQELQQLYAQVQGKEQLESELRLAYTIQSSLLPKHLPKVPGWELAAQWNSAKEVSGDFYDCFPVPDKRWGFIVADVAGKGVPAALFMAFCRTLTRTFCMDGRAPLDALRRVNDLIIANSSSELFVTMVYGLLDPRQGTLTYVNAGHPRLLWFRQTKNAITKLEADGMALGVLPGVELEQKTVELAPGDVVLFYTDGMSEATSRSGQLFGDRRIQAALRELAMQKPAQILNGLGKKVADFTRGRSPNDDLTAIALKRKKPN